MVLFLATTAVIKITEKNITRVTDITQQMAKVKGNIVQKDMAITIMVAMAVTEVMVVTEVTVTNNIGLRF